MGEEEKKPEETKVEEKKPEQPLKKEEEKKETEKPPTEEEKKPEESKEVTPREIVLKVFMHCEGCARKVRRSLKGFPGVEDVVTDCKSHKVIVKGEKADPLKVLERVQRKSHRQVELLSPIPKPPSEEEKQIDEKEKPKPEEEKKVEEPKVIIVILKVHMHCEACSQEIKRRIEKIKGVESAEPDLKNSLVTVKGVLETDKLVEYVYKRTGKQAVIVKQEPEKKEESKETKEEEKKTEEGEKDQKGSGEVEEKKEAAAAAEGDGKPSGDGEGGAEEVKVVELKRNEYYFNPPRYGTEFYAYAGPAYPPQIFSDENPNACSIM
ncbi:putative heavy metal-associated domain, HMA [Medicago truncatula]|uniref:Heavy metal-associated domain protein n=1 Tax=Medicago truncatula TaxID=3880 RepID=A0A072TUA8_MEDTR|nr:heavy metal-associated isoprenylated plant protein 7 [Medicago truncatula]KEH21012.1 heavy metal-associated domain protein [Medicago truncatula]RHN43293.1 putative heavy metal-associated domain, HMA [Medicago truncatula]